MNKPRNILLERRQAARLALARAATDPDPITDNVGTLARERPLCVCIYCNGFGDSADMISVQKSYHALCFRQAFGFEAVLVLPDTQQRKFRISDLSAGEMRKLLKTGATSMTELSTGSQISDEHGDLMQIQRDQLFEALRFAMPSATHDQVLKVVRAIDSFTSAKALEVLSQ